MVNGAATFTVSEGEGLTPGPKTGPSPQGFVRKILFKVTGQINLPTQTSDGGRKSARLASLGRTLYTPQLAAEKR